MTDTLSLSPDQPTRLRWRGRAVFLLGSTEHYGAVLHGGFDYETYLDAIAADGLNLTRIFAFFRELETSLGGQLGYANTLAPPPEQYLAPWARSADDADPAPDGLPKFDLETWDTRYFDRLRRFIAAADRRGVVVELVLFCNPYNEEQWRYVPLHPAGNRNGVGAAIASYRDYLTLADPSVVVHQERFVREAARATNEFDNLYYEICNEPTFYRRADPPGDPDPAPLRAWQARMIRALRETEAALPKRHLVAVNPHLNLPARDQDGPPAGRVYGLDDGYYRHDPEIDLLNVHYISQREPRGGLLYAFAGGAGYPDTHRFGSIAAFVALRAAARKAIGFDEDYTGFVHNLPPQPAQNRLEAWESFVAGCATYDHLDFTFTPADPRGMGAGRPPTSLPGDWFDGRPLRRQFGHLAAYAATLDLARLRPDLLAVKRAPAGIGAVAARAANGEGETVAVYLADLRGFRDGFGATALDGRIDLGGCRAGARYAVRALVPATGEWTDLPPVTADADGGLTVEAPAFREDALLHLDSRRG